MLRLAARLVLRLCRLVYQVRPEELSVKYRLVLLLAHLLVLFYIRDTANRQACLWQFLLALLSRFLRHLQYPYDLAGRQVHTPTMLGYLNTPPIKFSLILRKTPFL